MLADRVREESCERLSVEAASDSQRKGDSGFGTAQESTEDCSRTDPRCAATRESVLRCRLAGRAPSR
jgi:hypothetical protein